MTDVQAHPRVPTAPEALHRVQSVQLPPSTSRSVSRRDSPALFKRRQVTQYRPATQRAGALFLWLASVAGAVLWGVGGWTAWSTQSPNVLGAVLALVFQLYLSWAQLTACDNRKGVQYIVALAFSSGTTLLGYLPLVNLGLAFWFGVQMWTPWWWATIVAVTVIAIGLDIVPERTLLED